MRVNDADVVDEADIVLAVLRGQSHSVGSIQQQSRGQVDLIAAFVLSGESDVSQGRAIQLHRYVVRNSGDDSLQYDFEPGGYAGGCIQVRRL